MADPKELAKIQRRRGITKGSITGIETRLHQLEGESDQPNTRDTIRQLLAKLKEHDTDFKRNHSALIDLVDDDKATLTGGLVQEF